MSKATQSLSGTAWVLAHCLHMVPGKEAQEMTPHGTGVCFILQATRPVKLCPSDTALNQRENGLVTPQRPGELTEHDFLQSTHFIDRVHVEHQSWLAAQCVQHRVAAGVTGLGLAEGAVSAAREGAVPVRWSQGAASLWLPYTLSCSCCEFWSFCSSPSPTSPNASMATETIINLSPTPLQP